MKKNKYYQVEEARYESESDNSIDASWETEKGENKNKAVELFEVEKHKRQADYKRSENTNYGVLLNEIIETVDEDGDVIETECNCIEEYNFLTYTEEI